MSTPSTEQLVITLFGWLSGIFLLFIGLIFTLVGSFEIYRGQKTHDWPSTRGRIIRSEIASSSSTTKTPGRTSRKDTDYSVRVRYAYQVADQKLEGKRLQYGHKSHDQRSSAREEQSRYPSGKDVPVYYDPKIPKRSVLVQGSRVSWPALVFGPTALVLGLLSTGFMARRRKTGAGKDLPGRLAK